MQDPNPTLILIFGPFDPSGSSGLPADAVTCATLGAHALSALTAIHVQDSAIIEDIQEVAPELIDDQARCILEDMTVKAIKAGPLYTIESVRVLAQIAADYSQVPLLLNLKALPDQVTNDDNDPEDVLSAIFELLLPQTDLVLMEHNLTTHWQSDGLLSNPDDMSVAQSLLNFGAQWILTTAAPMRPGQASYLLQGPESATFSWPYLTPSSRLNDVNGPLGCALTIELAKGLPVPQAVETAINYAAPLVANTFQPGMGNRLINRSI